MTTTLRTPALGAPRVLVVQTDRLAAARWREALRICGLAPRVTRTVDRALRALAKSAWDALVVDLDATADGLGLVSAVRAHERTSTLPIIALSRATDGAVEDLARACGCDRVVVGEIDHAALGATLAATLSHGQKAA